MEYLFDTELALDSLQKIKAMLDLITERASVVKNPMISCALLVV